MQCGVLASGKKEVISLLRRGKNLQKPTPGKGRKYIKAVTAVSASHYFARRLFVILYMVRRAGIAPALYLTSRIYSPLPSLLGAPTHIKAGGKGILDASCAALRIFAMSYSQLASTPIREPCPCTRVSLKSYHNATHDIISSAGYPTANIAFHREANHSHSTVFRNAGTDAPTPRFINCRYLYI